MRKTIDNVVERAYCTLCKKSREFVYIGSNEKHDFYNCRKCGATLVKEELRLERANSR